MQPIDAVNEYLTGLYRQLHVGFVGLEEVDSSRFPQWQPLDEDLAPVTGRSENACLLDPEVGVALYLLRFTVGPGEVSGTDVRAQVARAIGFRSQLLPRRIQTESSDELGSWRIVLLWLVDRAQRADWQEQVSVLRRDTAHLDELPVDAIVADAGNWVEAVKEHGLPRLLLRTRRVLRMENTHAVFEWSNADAQVHRAMAGFVSQFSDATEKKIAQQLESRCISEHSSSDTQPADAPSPPRHLDHLEIRDFRNIRHIEHGFDQTPASCTVVHGPNGTGKSNLFEAIEFAVRGISNRAEHFLSDSDVTTAKARKVQEYHDQYLVRIGAGKRQPLVAVNGEHVSLIPDETLEPGRAGNLLSQDDSRLFVDKDARELAAEILGEFSGLAEDLMTHAEQHQRAAQSERTSLLAELDLSAAITKTETAKQRVALVLLQDLVRIPAGLEQRLTEAGLTWSPATNRAAGLAVSLRMDGEALEKAATGVAKSLSEPKALETVQNLLLRFSSVHREVEAFFSRIDQIKDKWPPELERKMRSWARWLQERPAQTPTPSASDLVALSEERQKLQKELETLARKGSLYGERQRHIEQLLDFLNDTWLKAKPQNERCPSCDTDLRDRGGVLAVAKELKEANLAHLESLRSDYRKTKFQLSEVEKQITPVQTDNCPLTDAEQDSLRQALAPYLPVDLGLADLLQAPAMLEQCLEWIRAVLKPKPSFGAVANFDEIDAQIGELIDELRRRFERIDQAFRQPTAWTAVVKALKTRLAEVMDRHLPDTLEGLWREFVLNLTPAPWQMLGDLGMRVDNKRGNQQARLVLREADDQWRMARYVLNRAETHALGLAWFFVRYLIDGRFRASVLVLDDPALDMDQTTFRDFCRLMESLLRLHRVLSIPFTLLILLHQDERALDAARATDALMMRLVWNRGAAELAKALKLKSDEMLHPHPEGILWEGISATENAGT